MWTRRKFLATGSAAVAAAALSPAVPASALLARPFVAYSADSYFRSSAVGLPVDPALTESFQAFMATNGEQQKSLVPGAPVLRGVDGNPWGTAYAMGLPGDPVWKLTGNIPAVCADLGTAGFYAPANLGSLFTGTNDSPFVVIDRVSGQSIWAANAVDLGGNVIQVSASGRFKHTTNGLDRRNPLSNGPQNERSRGCIPDAMAIRRDLLTWAMEGAGRDLGHVLHMFIVQSETAAGFKHPMVNQENNKYGWGAEGQRLALRSTFDVNAWGLSPAAKVIALTLKKRGCYIGDNSGSGTALKLAIDGQSWASLLQADSLATIPWTEWVALA